MQLRGLLLGVAALVVLGGLYWWSERNEASKDNASSDTSKLFSLKDEEVNRIAIERQDQPPTVLARDESGWQIVEPKPMRVDADAVSGLVSSFTGLTQDRLVEEKTADLAQFGLADPALRVVVNGKQTLLIGDETPTGSAHFAKLEGDPRVFSIGSGTRSSLDKSWKDLQDKRLLTFDENRVTRVELAGKGQPVAFGRDKQNEWQIVEPRPMRADNWAVEEVVRQLREARMDTSISDEDAAKYAARFGSASRVARATVTDASGTQTLEVRKAGEDYLARSSAVEGVHKIGSTTAEALAKGVEDFRNRKLFDFGFAEPTKVEIRHGERPYHFVKGGEKWWANGKEMDAASVQSLIDSLRDLSASGFAEGALPPSSVMEITVTSNDGKRVERVRIARGAGDTYLAQRENDPTLYRIDSNTVEEIGRKAADVKAPPPPQNATGGAK